MKPFPTNKEDKVVKKIAVAATALALIATAISAAPASANTRPENARYGLACAKAGTVAAKRGADGSDLYCKVATQGSFKGKRIWQYPKYPTLRSMDVLVPAGAGGGYDTTARRMMDAMRAEGVLLSNATFRNLPGAGGTTGLSSFLNNDTGRSGRMLMMGFALVGGVQSTKVSFKNSDVVGAARLIGEYEVLVVPADSPYKTLQDLVRDIRTQKTALPIAGGNLGGIDHYTAVQFYEALGLTIKDLNYIVYSGGAQVTAALLNGTAKAGISGWGEFQGQVEAGTLRVLGITAAKRVSGINARTFNEQGVNLVSQNWRALMLPKGTSAADRNLVIRALDVARNSDSWKASMKANVWSNNWLPGAAYDRWLIQEENKIKTLYTELGL
jgi:putative tricarboxylic transport membrane protein